MNSFPESVNELINQFARLPGIGKKTAQRLTFYILNSDKSYFSDLSRSLDNVQTKINNCSVCYSITETDLCLICEDVNRDKSVICVVENAYEIFVFENTNSFKGMYQY